MESRYAGVGMNRGNWQKRGRLGSIRYSLVQGRENVRRLRWILVAVLLGLSFSFIFHRMAFHVPEASAAQAQTAVRLATASTVSTKSPSGGVSVEITQVAPPGSALYWAKRGDTVISVAHHYLAQTSLPHLGRAGGRYA